MRQKIYGTFITVIALALTGAIGIQTFGGAWITNSSLFSETAGPVLYTREGFIGVSGIENNYQLSSLEEAPALAGEILGIYNSGNEFFGKDVNNYGDNSFYRLTQAWEGYPVWGRGASLLADGSGNVYAASSNYVHPENVITEQNVSEEECLTLAESYARDTLEADESSEILAAPSPEAPLIVCLSEDHSTGWLCRQILVSFSDSSYIPVNYTLLISVSDGSVRKAEAGVYGAEAFGEFDTLPETATVEIDGDTITFSDTSRNIDVYNANGEAVITQAWAEGDWTTYRFTGYRFYTKQGAPLLIEQSQKDMAANLPWTLGGLTVLHTAEGVFDYFADYCQRFGPNGHGGKYSLIYNCKYREGSERPLGDLGADNGFTSAGDQLPYYWTCLYSDFDLSSYEDLGHEYTHTILGSFFKAGASNHSKALLEAYCDIFGILADVYATGDEPDWENSYRDLLPDSDSIGSDGKTGGILSASPIQYYDYDKYISDPDYAGYDYQGCTIAGYATALLWEDWRESMSREEALRNMSELIWTSLFYLQDYPSYEDFAWAFYASACRLDLTKEQLDAVLEALKRVNLPTDWSDGHTTKMDLSEIDTRYSSELLEACAAVIESGDTELTRANEEYIALRLLLHDWPRILLDTIWSGAQFNDGTFVWEDASIYDLGKYFWSIFGSDCLISLNNLRYFSEYEDGYQAAYPLFKAEDSRWSIELEPPEMNMQTMHLNGTVTSPESIRYDFCARLERLGENAEGLFFDGYVLEELDISKPEQTGAETENSGTSVSLLLEDKLASLVSQYGVIDTGEDESWSGNEQLPGIMQQVVPPERLTGLLCADIYDYDQDGQDELLTLRLESGDYEAGGTSNRMTSLTAYLAMYDTAADAGETAEISVCGEQTLTVTGLPDSECSAFLRLFRSDGGSPWIYMDYYLNSNNQSFGTLAFRYTASGGLEAAGGAECTEYPDFAGHYLCSILENADGLDALCGELTGADRSGWTDVKWYDWEGGMPDDYRESYLRDYREGMKSLGLADLHSCSYQAGDNISIEGIYAACERRPSERYERSDGGTISDLGGILSPFSSRGVLLSVYDETGTLDAFR